VPSSTADKQESRMFERSLRAGIALAALAAASAHAAPAAPTQPAAPAAPAARPHARPTATHAAPALDRTGRRRIGKVSIYAHRLDGRTMADGTRLDARQDVAASRTLPLGTTARVTNLETGDSTIVTIRDRGPHVKGRIVDLSPAAAAKAGIDRHEGVSTVSVTPIRLPPAADGRKAHGRGPVDADSSSTTR
jgi:rare lipoprotein A